MLTLHRRRTPRSHHRTIMTLVLRTARPEKAHFPFRVGRKTILISFAGRGALPDWLKYSYVTPNFSRAVSRGVEYAANDFALHQVALGLNLTSDAAYYLNRSRNWRNYWNPSTASLNYTGFVQPRAANASFISYSPVSSPPSRSVSDDISAFLRDVLFATTSSLSSCGLSRTLRLFHYVQFSESLKRIRQYQ